MNFLFYIYSFLTNTSHALHREKWLGQEEMSQTCRCKQSYPIALAVVKNELIKKG
jgi:hypothetical protein